MTDIFVFGSNLAGRHGRGAAKTAQEKYGARYGKGVGLWGQSYAIPTKDENLQVLPIEQIKKYVADFKWLTNMEGLSYTFYITRVGTGLAGYSDADIAPLFKGVNPAVCYFDEKWLPFLGNKYRYWGTYV